MKRLFTYLIIFNISVISAAVDGRTKPGPKHSFVDFLQDYLSLRYEGRDFSEYVYISVKKQQLYYIKDGEVVKEYVISTSSTGVGNNKNSEKTPLGLHVIKNKIGKGVPLNGIFINRQYNGRKAVINTGKVSSVSDDVTSRILWLAGLEWGVNKGGYVDSYERNIYIHGTPDEGLLGTPSSHGCVRMSNQDVIELFNLLHEGTYVIILNN